MVAGVIGCGMITLNGSANERAVKQQNENCNNW